MPRPLERFYLPVDETHHRLGIPKTRPAPLGATSSISFRSSTVSSSSSAAIFSSRCPTFLVPGIGTMSSPGRAPRRRLFRLIPKDPVFPSFSQIPTKPLFFSSPAVITIGDYIAPSRTGDIIWANVISDMKEGIFTATDTSRGTITGTSAVRSISLIDMTVAIASCMIVVFEGRQPSSATAAARFSSASTGDLIDLARSAREWSLHRFRLLFSISGISLFRIYGAHPALSPALSPPRGPNPDRLCQQGLYTEPESWFVDQTELWCADSFFRPIWPLSSSDSALGGCFCIRGRYQR